MIIISEITLEKIQEYLPQWGHIISVTEVGSGMWGMRQVSSDYDLVVIYCEDMVDYLSGRNYRANLPELHGVIVDGKEIEFSYMEAGHLVNLLKKGNIKGILLEFRPVTLT